MGETGCDIWGKGGVCRPAAPLVVFELSASECTAAFWRVGLILTHPKDGAAPCTPLPHTPLAARGLRDCVDAVCRLVKHAFVDLGALCAAAVGAGVEHVLGIPRALALISPPAALLHLVVLVARDAAAGLCRRARAGAVAEHELGVAFTLARVGPTDAFRLLRLLHGEATAQRKQRRQQCTHDTVFGAARFRW